MGYVDWHTNFLYLYILTLKFVYVISLIKDEATKKLVQQFEYVTTKLEIALSNLPFNHFCISDEVQEQVNKYNIIFVIHFFLWSVPVILTQMTQECVSTSKSEVRIFFIPKCIEKKKRIQFFFEVLHPLGEENIQSYIIEHNYLL